MGSGYFRDFAKYSSLNVMGMAGLSCYILADTYFVSKGLGANGLAALNLAIPIYSFIHGSGRVFGLPGAAAQAANQPAPRAGAVNRYGHIKGPPAGSALPGRGNSPFPP